MLHTPKTYNDYHQNDDPQGKKLRHMTEKVTCECGTICCRVNLEIHKKTIIHAKRLEAATNIDVIHENINKMEDNIEKIQRDIEISKKRIERMKKLVNHNCENVIMI